MQACPGWRQSSEPPSPPRCLLLGVIQPGPTCREMLRRYEPTQEIRKLVRRRPGRRKGLGRLDREERTRRIAIAERPAEACEDCAELCQGAGPACSVPVHRRPRRAVA